MSLAFYISFMGIRETVMINPDVLMILGGAAGVLCILGLWRFLTARNWAIPLLIGLAVFDMIGELVTQSRLDLVVTVSFAVASTLLALLLTYQVRLSRLMEGSDHLAHAG